MFVFNCGPFLVGTGPSPCSFRMLHTVQDSGWRCCRAVLKVDLGILCQDEHRAMGERREDLGDLPEGVRGMLCCREVIVRLVRRRQGDQEQMPQW